MSPLECGQENRWGKNAANGGTTASVTRDINEIEARLGSLREDHSDLDDAISALVSKGTADQLQMARLKRRKLRLRDEIKLLEDQLIPNIIA